MNEKSITCCKKLNKTRSCFVFSFVFYILKQTGLSYVLAFVFIYFLNFAIFFLSYVLK